MSNHIPRILLGLLVLLQPAYSQELYPIKLPATLWHNQQRELRYRPEGTDFVITNGNRLFTRALYGTNTAFRIESGDRPEFALYMPGMGGNLRLGIVVDGQSKWLTDAQTIIARYRPGARLYTISDPLLSGGQCELAIQALADGEGLVLKTRFENVPGSVELIWAFGGATGKKFSRDGDMGPDPESNFYLKPENCKDNSYAISSGTFSLTYGTGQPVGPDGRYFVEDAQQPAKPGKEQRLSGTFPPASILTVGDATKLTSPLTLEQSAPEKAPVLVGRLAITSETDAYLTIYNPATQPMISYGAVADVFRAAETKRAQLAGRVVVKTPDPYLNTIGGALAIASDAIWESPSYMHGAIGWRMRLNGWRGPYTADPLGWHDRARAHLSAYAASQVTSPAAGPIVPDTAMHLARSTEKLGIGMFSSGYISRDPNGKNLRAHHYDMNLVYIDALLRHYQWTGDLAFVKETWPVLKRHLAWETRHFDPDGDGLYDAYAAIWASDALQYSGGGVTHTSAYNCLAYQKAARIALLLGDDPLPYRRESEKIRRAMNALLWLPTKGTYGEFRDQLGNRLVHPAPAIWTIYHSLDSDVPDAFQAWQSVRYIDTDIPHIPVRAVGLDDGNYYTISTSGWMPYTWSLNNVALGESMHTALANWQAGRTDEAFTLFKSEVLASMYLGGSPGNIVQISHYDATRGEAYRDFADPIGMFSRALVEGLFGIVPDALNKTLTIRPGLPAAWHYASISLPDLSFDFKREGRTDTYLLRPSFPTKLNLKFQVIAQGQVKRVTVNGKQVAWTNVSASVGKPVIEIGALPADAYRIELSWAGAKPVLPVPEQTYTTGRLLSARFAGARVMTAKDPQQVLSNIELRAQGLTAQIKAAPGTYTAFLQVKQGDLSWWMPLCFRVDKPVTVRAVGEADVSGSAFRLQNNTGVATKATVQINDFIQPLDLPSGTLSAEVTVPKEALIPGTNNVSIRLPNGTIVTERLIDWSARTNKRLETVGLSRYYNDRVTQLFRNKYLSPRPQVTTLQLPWQGIGDWPHPLERPEIDDSGLRRLAGSTNQIVLPQGIPFNTPGSADAKNILFTSQWDNYPRQQTIPLTGNSSHAWLLMAGSTNPMQSQFINGAVVVTYTDGSRDSLALRNPETWWPIEKEYYTDGFAFSLKQPRPIRIHLKTGAIVSGEESKQTYNGRAIAGGAATVLDLPLNPSKMLKSLTLKTIANDVVIGLMSLTLARE
ncbi:DUF4450 domain-containing protein [Fibrella arboris]|uniref:DUF4450 domain-containing protein n=1 Tax=Fibrella arboris TaxID=3242486 RepID=UPI003522534F